MGVIINFPTLIESTGIDTSDATATASDIVVGKTAYVNGKKIVGTHEVIWSDSTVSVEVTSVNIPNGVTSILGGAFYNCASLESITIPDSVTSIGSATFSGGTNLASITIPDSITSIGSYAFSDTALIKNQTGVKYADTWVIDCDTDVTSAEIKDGTRGIGGSAFKDCINLESVTIPNSVTSIIGDAFRQCESLTSITIPDSVTMIGSQSFYGCSSLGSIIIPDDVTMIGSYTFHNCTSLESITIPDSVTNIGSYAFSNCTSLANIYYKGTEEQWNAIIKGGDWSINMGSNVEGRTVITYNYTG